MITRVWHGKTKKADAAAYKQYVMQTGIPGYLDTPGNLGAQIWQREEGDIVHIWTVSWWKDYDSIKAFAGEQYERARYYDEDEKYLLEFEPNVLHCETEIFERHKREE